MNTNKIILGLDDDKEELHLITEHFNKAGITDYFLCDNEREFVENLTEDVKMVIIDHYINGEAAGYRLLQEIRHNDVIKNRMIQTKVIIISGQQDIKWLIKYENHGADYLHKGDRDFYALLVHTVKRNMALIEEKMEVIASVERIMRDIQTTANEK